jgi:hypothetical protein
MRNRRANPARCISSRQVTLCYTMARPSWPVCPKDLSGQVREVYGRVRSAIGDEHSAEVDPDEQAALVTAIVLQHGLPLASAFRQVRALVVR